MDYKKIIAPIVVTVILISYFIFFILGILSLPDLPGFKFWGIGIPMLFIGYSIFALLDRIKEIRSGEEDDLSKY